MSDLEKITSEQVYDYQGRHEDQLLVDLLKALSKTPEALRLLRQTLGMVDDEELITEAICYSIDNDEFGHEDAETVIVLTALGYRYVGDEDEL